jgi:hypothetical protein
MAASNDIVVWTPDFCTTNVIPFTRIYDRDSGDVIQLNQALRPGFTSDGRLTDDIGFGIQRIMDPETLEHLAVIPLGSQIRWSSDYRWAAHGENPTPRTSPCR